MYIYQFATKYRGPHKSTERIFSKFDDLVEHAKKIGENLDKLNVHAHEFVAYKVEINNSKKSAQENITMKVLREMENREYIKPYSAYVLGLFSQTKIPTLRIQLMESWRSLGS